MGLREEIKDWTFQAVTSDRIESDRWGASPEQDTVEYGVQDLDCHIVESKDALGLVYLLTVGEWQTTFDQSQEDEARAWLEDKLQREADKLARRR